MGSVSPHGRTGDPQDRDEVPERSAVNPFPSARNEFKNKLSPYARAWTCIGILRRRDENPRRGSTEQGGSLAEMGVAEGNGAMP